jgi:hypothetical protein
MFNLLTDSTIKIGIVVYDLSLQMGWDNHVNTRGVPKVLKQ